MSTTIQTFIVGFIVFLLCSEVINTPWWYSALCCLIAQLLYCEIPAVKRLAQREEEENAE